jgi:hypothetical protein
MTSKTTTTTTTTTTAGQPIQCMAMVARAAKQPLTAEMITVDPPKAGEVRVKVVGTSRIRWCMMFGCLAVRFVIQYVYCC